MKYVYYLFILSLLISCSKEVEINPTKANKKQIAENTNFLLRGPAFDQCITTTNIFSDNKESTKNSQLRADFNQILYSKVAPNIKWKRTDKLIQTGYAKIIGENEMFSKQEIKLTRDIQFISLSFIEHYLIPKKLDNEIADKIIYHLNLVYKHKGVDLNSMANALLHVQDFIENKKFLEIKNYLLSSANANTNYVKNNYKELYKKYKTTEGKEKQSYLMAGYRLSDLSKEAKYVRDILGGEYISQAK